MFFLFDFFFSRLKINNNIKAKTKKTKTATLKFENQEKFRHIKVQKKCDS